MGSDSGSAKPRRGDAEGAIADLDKALKLDSHLSNAYVVRGEAKIRVNDFDGAIADCTEALEHDVEDAFAWRVRAMAKSRKGDRFGASADSKECRRLDPHFSETHDWALSRPPAPGSRPRGRLAGSSGAMLQAMMQALRNTQLSATQHAQIT